MEHNKPVVKLNDGNAFAILGACRRASRKAGWTDKQWQEFNAVATSGDYDKLLCAVMEHFEVE